MSLLKKISSFYPRYIVLSLKSLYQLNKNNNNNTNRKKKLNILFKIFFFSQLFDVNKFSWCHRAHLKLSRDNIWWTLKVYMCDSICNEEISLPRLFIYRRSYLPIVVILLRKVSHFDVWHCWKIKNSRLRIQKIKYKCFLVAICVEFTTDL